MESKDRGFCRNGVSARSNAMVAQARSEASEASVGLVKVVQGRVRRRSCREVGAGLWDAVSICDLLWMPLGLGVTKK